MANIRTVDILAFDADEVVISAAPVSGNQIVVITSKRILVVVAE